MQKTRIEWTDYTWNPIKGICPVGCEYCYAVRFYRRFKFNPEIRLDRGELEAPLKVKKPSKIFVGSTIEMYHPAIPSEWVSYIIAISYSASWHTYITLTKYPQNLKSVEFPEWWWIGVTVDNPDYSSARMWELVSLIDLRDNIKFVSFEPLLGEVKEIPAEIDWIIVGARTQPYIAPERKWVEKIIEIAKVKNIKIFLKNNLFKAYPDLPKIQEFPNIRFKSFKNTKIRYDTL